MTPVANALIIIADRIARTHPEEAEALFYMAASCRAHNELVLRLIDENKRLGETVMDKAADAMDELGLLAALTAAEPGLSDLVAQDCPEPDVARRDIAVLAQARAAIARAEGREPRANDAASQALERICREHARDR